MISAMKAAVRIPVTIKIRIGWDDDHINALEVAKIAEQAGAVAITIHGRTREQGYRGPANWEPIRQCKASASKIIVIGNGDVFDPASAERMFAFTGCDGVLVSRGTMGQPWIAEDIRLRLSGQIEPERTVAHIREALLEHFGWIVDYQPERQAMLDMRRVGCWYLKRCNGAKALRMQINQAPSVSEVFREIQAFPWETLSLSTEMAVAASE